jgi:hypothetical protein
MTSPWKEIRCVSLRVDDLQALADLRGQAEIRVTLESGRAWLFWPATSDAMAQVLARRIMPLAGVEVFTERAGTWYRLGERLPAFGVPIERESTSVPLDQAVIPTKLSAERPNRDRGEPLVVRVVRDHAQRARDASALRCSLRVLCAWADRATSSQLARVHAAWLPPLPGETGDAEALVLGAGGVLPLLPRSVRYWGTELLVPLGYRAEPDLPAPALRRVVGAGSAELAILDEDGCELIARAAFGPLCRASVRLAHDRSCADRPEQGNWT